MFTFKFNNPTPFPWTINSSTLQESGEYTVDEETFNHFFIQLLISLGFIYDVVDLRVTEADTISEVTPLDDAELEAEVTTESTTRK
jgi:hypothetical protein